MLKRGYKVISFYKHLFLKSNLGVSTYCKHQPRCSQYFFEKLEQEGLIKAIAKGTVRILTCW
jgi:putative component of membrane protein insertase Oxa1/YidC/SpoIIIJ protein YidD